ncbi:hypothetical protein VTL71DRAFT_710 [Oculimacula yallundae]|uniref:Nephrocystin 3-like N-terminal domain-containing protein n=1 Tax=Oculimacula yallundae TaxID=86028 RepID=A0ABR4D1S2_9HELO
MAEAAFAIIGTTAALLQLSEFTVKVVYSAYGLYSSGANQTVENESIENITSKLSSLLDSLHNDPLSQSSENQAFTELVRRCQGVVERLLSLLKKCEAKKPKSVRQSLRASIRTQWAKTDVEALYEELQDCQNLLGVFLIVRLKSDFGGKLQEIVNANAEQRKQVALLREQAESSRHGQDVGIETLNKIWQLLNVTETQLRIRSQTQILNALRFKGMGARAQTTQITSRPQNIIPRLAHQRRGSFHISGKMGAGKSTLMKYLVNHPSTKINLKKWAGSRRLIFAQFFFWKPGDRLEKTLEGLIRSIVHTILSELPEMIPLVFPQYLDLSREFVSEPASELDIPYETVFDAVEKLLGEEHRETLKEHCFCFFIDGLDELDDPQEEHVKLAKRLRAWTLRRPMIKICVSSREENSFMTTFPPSQRLRLHLLTADDIRKTVELSLSNHDTFHEFIPKERQKLVEDIVQKAQGVFLWVKLVLRMLGEDLLASQSIGELHRTLDQVPTEIGALYTKMLTTFESEDHKHEAWAILAVLLAVDGGRLSCTCIFHYSYVKDYLRNDRFSEDSAIRSTPMSEISLRQTTFTLQLKRLLKGLVDVDTRDPYSPEDDPIQPESSCHSFRGRLQLTHRSMYEFLQNNCPEEMTKFMGNLDVKSILLQIFIVHVKLVQWDYFMLINCRYFLEKYIKWLMESSSEKHFQQLTLLDDLLRVAQHIQRGSNLVNEIDWSRFKEFQHPYSGLSDLTGTFLSAMALSFNFGFVEYVAWARKHRNAFLVQDKTRLELFVCLLHPHVNPDPKARVELLRHLVNEGFIDEKLLTCCRPVGLGPKTPWECFVFGLSQNLIEGNMSDDNRSSLGDTLEVLLQFQVDPGFVFKTKLESSDSETSFEMKVRRASDRVTWDDIGKWNFLLQAHHKDIKPISSFRELVEANFPERKDLLRQIDRNLALYQKSILSWPVIIVGILVSLSVVSIMNWYGSEAGALTDQLV